MFKLMQINGAMFDVKPSMGAVSAVLYARWTPADDTELMIQAFVADPSYTKAQIQEALVASDYSPFYPLALSDWGMLPTVYTWGVETDPVPAHTKVLGPEMPYARLGISPLPWETHVAIIYGGAVIGEDEYDARSKITGEVSLRLAYPSPYGLDESRIAPVWISLERLMDLTDDGS
jgi:hypothetical protein